MLERDFGYNPPIPKDLQEKYETELSRVQRWRGGNWRQDINETDWHHVVGMFRVLKDINRVCLTLSSDIDTQTAKHMIYIHDQGEISVGDLTHNRHDYDTRYTEWKRREYIAGKWQLRKIKNRDIRRKAMELYDRCFNIRDEDKEALLTDLIDKIQGSRFGYANVFHGREMKKQQRQMQFNHTVELLGRSGRPLLQLVSATTQADLKVFLQSELEGFAKSGYRREAEPYIQNLGSILQKKL